MTKSKKKSKLLLALLEPQVQRFINKSLLIESDEFLLILDASIAQYKNDRNWSILRDLAQVFSKTKYFLPLVTYISDYAGLRYFIKGNSRLHFLPIKDEWPKPRYRDFSNYLVDQELRRSLRDLRSIRDKTKKRRQAKGGDAMIRRLPGSFGSGR